MRALKIIIALIVLLGLGGFGGAYLLVWRPALHQQDFQGACLALKQGMAEADVLSALPEGQTPSGPVADHPSAKDVLPSESGLELIWTRRSQGPVYGKSVVTCDVQFFVDGGVIQRQVHEDTVTP